MSKKRTRPMPIEKTHDRSNGEVHWLTVVGARQNNLKDLVVGIPLQRFVCVTGVSGSGKSSLINDIVRNTLLRDLNGAERTDPGDHDKILGADLLDKVIDIDQSPIGRTPRSNPATYIKVFDQIRALYTKLPDAKVRGYQPGRFSFNVSTGVKGGGRCEACEGNGANKIEMDFLADIWVTCPVCQGRRFSRETLEIQFKGKCIADVLEMDVQEALEHFAKIPKIAGMLQTLHDVGMDYMKLGQSSTTLSGGEAQRIKLARELVKKSTGRTLYLLDEPTTGLHFDDIKKLLAVLHGFVDAGNSVIVIEHNLDVVKTADWIIDLGPEGGEGGGRIVAQGTPEHVAKVKGSYTGQVLHPVLFDGRRRAGAQQPSPKRQRGAASATLRPLGKSAPGAKALAGKPPVAPGRVTPGAVAPGDGQRIAAIEVVGARQHNLKNINVSIPRGKTSVFAGPSGSGKSSLAFDTIYAEGQRRYVESLSAYARQFLGQLEKPRVDHVYGLSPAIAIEQKAPSKSPRSTVGTVTEIYDYMRVLWARIGQPYCPKCKVPVGTQSSDEIIDRILELAEGTRALLLAPVQRMGNETYRQLFEREQANGFTRARVDGEIFSLDEPVDIDHRRRHEVELVVDRIIIKARQRSRITDSVEQALAVGGGVIKLAVLNGEQKGKASSRPTTLRFSQLHSCDQCGTSYDELTPHHFSFNARMGWCERCEGLGVQRGASPAAIAVHPGRSILDGALAGWENARGNPVMSAVLYALANAVGFDVETPWCDLSESQRLAVLQGTGNRWIDISLPRAESKGIARATGGRPARGTRDTRSSRSGLGGEVEGDTVPGWQRVRFRWKGFFPAIDRATRSSWQYRKRLEELVTDVPCEGCSGARLRPESRFVYLTERESRRGGTGPAIEEVCRMPLDAALVFFTKLKLDRRQRKVAGELLHEITSRLRFLVDVGLEYLTLDRSAPTLSGGESQRIRLASQIGSGLTGVLYVLDEPTIGLHPRDTGRLIGALRKLRDLGNTLIVVEHDREIIDHADQVFDFGPGAGLDGGRIVAADSPRRLRTRRTSLTGKYLSGAESIPVPSNRRSVKSNAKQRVPEHWLTVVGARHNNLREIDVGFPLSRFTVVTGVSGSGKSSLVTDILYNALATRIHRARLLPGGHQRIIGAEHIDKVINVDQSPIGNSPSSNAATYTGVFDWIRELFARLPDAKVRGYTANRFSFNRPGGRCEACFGNGQQCIEMHFLPDVWIKCESCGGARYVRETLEVKYKGKSIANVLNMRVSEACAHFEAVPKIRRMLQTLDDVGLGYLPLGQSAATLSGGEAQRVKLAAELGRPSTGQTLYILDEPTTGLHFDDLKKLLGVLHRLVDLGNTVVCIEHNLDVIKTADFVIDMGPEAGDDGGRVVVADTPERVAKHRASYTGAALAPILAAGPVRKRAVFDATKQVEIERQLEGPLRLERADIQTKMPWQIDGRKWHTVHHLDRRGRPVQWNPKVLEWLVEAIEQIGGFAPADWNDRTRVEIKAPSPCNVWFVHFLTGGRDVLEITIRVPARHFDNKTVVRALNIKTLDEREDLPIYGQWPRVRLRASGREYDYIRIYPRDFKDIHRTAFKSFLKKAAQAYFDNVRELQSDPIKGQPWKADGRAWHLSQRSIHARHRVLWRPSLILELIGRISKFAPDIEFDWTGKIGIGMGYKGQTKRIGKIVTNLGAGVRCEFRVVKGAFTPLQIEKLGTSPLIQPRADHDVLTFWLRSIKDNDSTQFARVLANTRTEVSGSTAESA